MRFMVFLIPGDPQIEGGKLPDATATAAMMKYNEELAEAGVLLGVDSLQPGPKGARVRFSAGNAVVTDGPFAEARDVVSGFWLWQVSSKQEAIDWASRCPAAEGDVLELRQVAELGLRVRRAASRGARRIHERR